MKNKGKLQIKDFITIGVLNAVWIVIYYAIGMALGSTPIGWLVSASIAAIPCGVVYMLILAKVPKRGVITIGGVMFGIIMLATGHWLANVLVVVLFAFLGDLVFSQGEERTTTKAIISYMVYMIGFPISSFCLLIWFKDAYFNAYQSEMIPYFEAILNKLTLPVLLIVIVGSAIGALIGALLGKKFLNKHFEKAGMV